MFRFILSQDKFYLWVTTKYGEIIVSAGIVQYSVNIGGAIVNYSHNKPAYG